MASECLSNVKPTRSTDDRDNQLLLLGRLLSLAAIAMGLFAIVAPLFTGKPAPAHIDPHAYMGIGALGIGVYNVLGEQQKRLRELERLLKDHRTHAEPRAGSDGG